MGRNKTLFWLTQAYTVIIMGLFVNDFISQGKALVENNIVVVYLALLSAYAADKEFARYRGSKGPAAGDQDALKASKGSWFVGLWAIAYAAAYLAHLFGTGYKVPEGMSNVVLAVLGVFFGSGLVKRYVSSLKPEGAAWAQDILDQKESREAAGREASRRAAEKAMEMEAIQELLFANPGGLSTSEIAKGTRVPERSVFRYVAEMKAAGRVKTVGVARGTKYVWFKGK
jgi:hypothetical protein